MDQAGSRSPASRFRMCDFGFQIESNTMASKHDREQLISMLISDAKAIDELVRGINPTSLALCMMASRLGKTAKRIEQLTSDTPTNESETDGS